MRLYLSAPERVHLEENISVKWVFPALLGGNFSWWLSWSLL